MCQRELSACEEFHPEFKKGIQFYEEVVPDQPASDPVGRPIKHVSAIKQVTGEAIYVDDMPLLESKSNCQ